MDLKSSVELRTFFQSFVFEFKVTKNLLLLMGMFATCLFDSTSFVES